MWPWCLWHSTFLHQKAKIRWNAFTNSIKNNYFFGFSSVFWLLVSYVNTFVFCSELIYLTVESRLRYTLTYLHLHRFNIDGKHASADIHQTHTALIPVSTFHAIFKNMLLGPYRIQLRFPFAPHSLFRESYHKICSLGFLEWLDRTFGQNLRKE